MGAYARKKHLSLERDERNVKLCDFQYPDHGLPTPSGSDRSFPPLGVDEGHSPYECLKTRIHFGRRWWSLGFHGNWWSGRASPGSHVWSIPLLVLMSIESMFSYKLEAFLHYGLGNPADLWKIYAINDKDISSNIISHLGKYQIVTIFPTKSPPSEVAEW